jgi:hypothetical protein
MVAFDGLKVYRNNAPGIHIHRCQNIHVTNSIFADNNIAIDIDRAEGIEVSNTTIIGESPSYKALRARQAVGAVCYRGSVTGIDLHTWKVEKAWAGAKISNVDISGFGSVGSCAKAASMKFDRHTLKQGVFEFYTSFKGMKLQDGAERIDMCLIEQQDFKMLYIIDLDGTLRPSTVTTQGPSTLVASDNRELLKFVNTAKCTDVNVGCYQYCADTCFRSMRYSVTGADQANYQLKVCLRNDQSKCSLFSGGRRGDGGSHTFIAHLPVGNEYDAVFLNAAGQEIAPTEVTGEYEESLCPSGTIFDVTLYGKLPITSPSAPAPAPKAAPVAVPVRAPVAVPVRAPVAIPVAIPASIFSGLFLIQTGTGRESALTNTINLSVSGTALSIVAKTTGTSVVAKVSFWFDGRLVQTETGAPWAIKGDRAGKYTPYASLSVRGSHTVAVEAFSSSGTLLGRLSTTFTVV